MMIWKRREAVLLGLLLLILTVAVGAGASLAFNGGQDSAKIIPVLQASPIEFPISVQGILSDENGEAVPNGPHNITCFRQGLGVPKDKMVAPMKCN